jgi:hypothetical protein
MCTFTLESNLLFVPCTVSRQEKDIETAFSCPDPTTGPIGLGFLPTYEAAKIGFSSWSASTVTHGERTNRVALWFRTENGKIPENGSSQQKSRKAAMQMAQSVSAYYRQFVFGSLEASQSCYC